MSISQASQGQLCPSLSLSLLENTQQKPDVSRGIRQVLPPRFDDTAACFTCHRTATGEGAEEVAMYGSLDGSYILHAHPDCATKYNENLDSACRLASAVKAVMLGDYLQGVDPSKKGTFVCAIGRGRHTVDDKNPVRQVSSTTVSGRTERVCHSCAGSIPVYADSVGRAFSTATREPSGSVLLTGIEASPGNKQNVLVPWDRATEVHDHSHRDACTAATCSMAALADAVAQQRA